MIKPFIMQNIWRGGDNQCGIFYFLYGPNYANAIITNTDSKPEDLLTTSTILFGISFTKPLLYDEQDQLFRIVGKLSVKRENNITPITILVDYIVTASDIDINYDQKDFAIPIDLGFPYSQFRAFIKTDMTIELYNPNPNYEYLPPKLSNATSKYIAVIANLYMENKELNGYEGYMSIDLYNSSSTSVILSDYVDLKFTSTDTFINISQTTWVKRSDLISGTIKPVFNLDCRYPSTLDISNIMAIQWTIEDYNYIAGEQKVIVMGNDYLEMPLVTGESATLISNENIHTIPENNYLLFYVDTRLKYETLE